MLNKKFTSNWPLWAVVLLAGILWLLFSGSYLMRLEDIHSARLFEMDKCFQDQQIPCRWVPDLGGFYGYPFFNFYAPLPYYFGELLFFLTHNFAISVKVLFLISFLGSYLFLYILLRKFAGNSKAIALSLIYSFTPFYLLNFLGRGVLAEMWALMFFAACLLSFNRLIKNTNVRNVLFLGISIGLLLTSSNFSYAFFVPIILLMSISFLRTRKLRLIWFSLGGLLLGLLFSSFFLIPKILENNLIHNGYLPIYAKESPTREAQSRYQILTGETNVFNFEEGSNWIKFNADTKTHTIIRLSQYYFPDWKVFVDGKEIVVDYNNNSLGLMTFILGKGNHQVEAKLYDTPIRSFSNVVTASGFVIAAFLLLISFGRVRKWISYYRKGIN